jgi:hypothetical protein
MGRQVERRTEQHGTEKHATAGARHLAPGTWHPGVAHSARRYEPTDFTKPR